jgi:hypothetical protein
VHILGCLPTSDLAGVIANLLGCIGSLLVAWPFFRDALRKESLEVLRLPKAPQGADEALQLARRVAERGLNRFRPGEVRMAAFGLLMVALSYLINIVVWFFPPNQLGSG